MPRSILCFALMIAFSSAAAIAAEPAGRWSEEKANAWYKKTGWLVGCDYIPRTAINQLEMWQADTFDLKTIDQELAWAESLGFNSLRVYLHHLLWEQDREGLLKRMDQFLEVTRKHHIGVMFVLLDGCWDPQPKLGKQRAPRPRVHNSGWLQSPGAAVLNDPKRYDELEGYIKGVITRFKDDPRVQVWDLYNEPDFPNGPFYGDKDAPEKAEKSLALLKKAFTWAREVNPSQPLTCGVWSGTWADPQNLRPIEQIQLGHSDIISFHCYDGGLKQMKESVQNLRRYHRPILCTEYMARHTGSTFDPILGYLHESRVAAYNWGFVSGKTQTIYPWDSWEKDYPADPDPWFHDILRPDGTPFSKTEAAYIRKVTGAGKKK